MREAGNGIKALEGKGREGSKNNTRRMKGKEGIKEAKVSI